MQVVQLLFVLLLLSAGLILADEQDYCQIAACKGVPHVGCNHTETFAAKCLVYRNIIEMRYFSRYLLILHNERRNLVATGQTPGLPAAARMAEMSWNTRLAKMAEYHIMTCDLKTVFCAATSRFPNPGLNIGEIVLSSTERSHSNAYNIQDLIEAWMDEVWQLHPISVRQYPSKEVSMYDIHRIANVLRESNTHMGCAAAHISNWITHYYRLICYYATANVPGQAIYSISKSPGSDCRSGHSRAYPSMCKSSESYA